MLKCDELFIVTENQRTSVIESYGISKREYQEVLEKLKFWVDQSDHLPKDYEATLVQGVLLNVKMNIEKAKYFIENYFRIKSLYKGIAQELVPHTQKFRDSLKFAISVMTTRLTPTLNRVLIYKICDPEGKSPDIETYFVVLVAMCIMRGTFDFYTGTQVVIDMEFVTWKNFTKNSASFMFMIKEIFQSLHLRISGFHCINGSPLLETFLTLFSAVLPKKLSERIVVHRCYDTLYDHIPKECLPQDYGGTEKSLEVLRELWIEALDELDPFFQRIIIEAQSSKKYEFNDFQKSNLGIGVDGCFRQLTID